MKNFRVVLVGMGLIAALNGEDWARRAWQLESKGDAAGARELLQSGAQGTTDVSAWRAYAEFLDRHRDPGAREAYGKVLHLMESGSPRERAPIARRLTALDLLAGDREAAA